MNNIEIISVHYKTPELIYNQYQSVRKFYPTIPYRIIDGSDNAEIYFQDLEEKDEFFSVNRFGYNIHHGPGMDYGIRTSKFDFLLILDSDVSLKHPIIELMMREFKGYAVGKKIFVDEKGKESWQRKWWQPKGQHKITYIHPYCILICKDSYLQFKPFKKHGAPCIDAMTDIYNQNKTDLLSEVVIEEYVDLKICGTRSQWGINL